MAEPSIEKRDGAFLDEVRSAVDARLARFFAKERPSLARLAPEAAIVFDGLESLTLRGGKRLRPALLVAAGRAIDPAAPIERVASAAASLEILQSYLLIHDDWMDGDEERRGGPAVHVVTRRALGARGEGAQGAHLAASLAILAGDLGSAYANRLFLESAEQSPRTSDALHTYFQVQRDVVLGQTLDLLASEDVERMHALKTGSYTVKGPLLLGAILADAEDAQLDVLRRVADPLGRAFQVRDDLLGTFGDPKKTGKPVGNDLRVGKHNAVVRAATARLSPASRGRLAALLGRLDASDDEVRGVVRALEEEGVRAAVTSELDALVEAAKAPLRGAHGLAPAGVEALLDLAELFRVRED